MRVLRKYQLECVKRVFGAWSEGKSPLLVAPTGSGKTAMAAKMLLEKGRRGDRCCFIVPRTTLIEQAKKEFEAWGMDVGIVAGNWRENRRSQIQIVSFQSMDSRHLDWLQPEWTIIDECHITSFTNACLKWFPKLGEGGNRKGKVAGVTATPRRMKKEESLGQIFNQMILAPSIGDLMKLGYLVRPTYNICPNIVSGKMIYSPEYVWETFNKVGADLQTIIFPPSVRESKQTAELFKSRGVEAIAITDRTPINVRRNAFERFHNEELKVLISCVVLREGFDSPKATHLIAGFDWNSHCAAIQMYGRVLRPATFNDGTQKTSAIITDTCGIVRKHGRAEYITYSEEDLNLPDEFEKGKVPMKFCPECDSSVFAALPICPYCGHEFDIIPKRTILPEGGLIQELTEEERSRQVYYHKCLQVAFEQDESPKWARDRFLQKYGYEPPIDWRRNSVHPNKQNAKAYQNWLLASRDRSFVGLARQLEFEGVFENLYNF